MEIPITFNNINGERLFGIIHKPKEEIIKKKIGINLLNPGLKNRVAPNRINVKIARYLCKKGFYVLRFDPHGIGDSEGQINKDNNYSVLDMWGAIQSGVFVNDVIVANRYFKDKCKLKELVLIGQCGAAVTALISASREQDIKKLVLIDTPFRIVDSNMDINEIMSEYSDPLTLKRIIKKVAQIIKHNKLNNSYLNLKYYLNRVNEKYIRKRNKKKNKYNNTINERFNWRMATAFKTMIKRKAHIQFIYAENDFSLKEFNQDFKPNFISEKEQAFIYFNIIKDANHIYTEKRWQTKLMNIILSYLQNDSIF